MVCTSVSHGNTLAVAEAMVQVLDAHVVPPVRVDPADLGGYDLIGVGSGIFGMGFHPQLREFVAAIPGGQTARAFVFSTSGFPEPPFRPYVRRLVGDLEQKGFVDVDAFSCRALDTWWPFRPLGGIQKGHPDSDDLDAARAFARGLLEPRRAGSGTLS